MKPFNLPMLFIILSMLCVPGVYALDIRDLQYQYAYEVAKDMPKEAFVICENCPLRSGPKVSFLHGALNLLQIKMSSVQQPQVRQLARTILAETNVKPIIAVDPKPPQCPKETTTIDTKILGMVLFPLGESDLDSLNRKALDSIAERVTPGSNVSIYGYTCDIGSDSYNDKLSQDRADTVAAYLKTKGLKVDKTQGRGKTKPLSAIHRELNRRAEVNIKTMEIRH